MTTLRVRPKMALAKITFVSPFLGTFMNNHFSRFIAVHSRRFQLAIIVAICLGPSAFLHSQTSDQKQATFSDEQLEFFESKVRPILVEQCFECHGPDSKPIEGGLSLASRKDMLTGGDTGPAIAPEHPDKSLLIDAINYGDVYEMPPDTKMSDENIAILTKWVKDGAAWPSDSNVTVKVKESFDIAARKKAHWVWQPIKKSKPPKVKNKDWPKDPIDNFILDKIESAKLTPAEPAERPTLIRRAYFDLIGMPPTRQQIESFTNDKSEHAFEKVIDELLESPHFGERWARHWLDLSRYAESGGHEFDYEIRHAHKYRDYLIRAFNEDVSYKALIHEHIAGDLLKNPRRHPEQLTNESILGTGFWFLGEAKHAPVDAKDEEARTIDNQIDVMCKSFLGMTVACARCHDHKFDAISTEDYYAMAGFLQSSRRQEAMLDPGRKIENAFEKVSKIVRETDDTAKSLVKQLGDSNPKQFARYLSAAIDILQSDPTFSRSENLILEGESLKQKSVSGGETLVQEIAARGQFAWRGNKQYWWKHPKKGDTWELEFKVPEAFAKQNPKIKISGVFTKAGDYGSASISINNKVAIDQIDFYDPQLTTTGMLSIAELKLKAGTNVIKFECTGNNEKASPSRMIGLDYLQLSPVADAKSTKLNIEKVAKKAGLKTEVLKRLVAAIRNPATSRKSHGLNVVRQFCSQEDTEIKKLHTKLKREAEKATQQAEKWKNESTLFADFNEGLPDGWFRTGYAFGTDKKDDQLVFANAGQLLQSPSTVSSGRFGSQFYGVIRSPTFELNHKSIHYRYRGKDCTVRLIIDGYMMDEFNALLFNQCKIGIKANEQFSWQSQSGDLQHQLGRRAYIEIIDHGQGHIELDEIRMSNNARPSDFPNPITTSIVAANFDSQKSFCEAYAIALVEQINESSIVGCELVDWITKNDFGSALGMTENATSQNDLDETTYVSLSTQNKPKSNLGRTKRSVISAAAIAKLSTQLKSQREKTEALSKATPAPELAIAMTEGTSEDEFIFIRGNHKTLGKIATRKFLTAISPRPLNPPDGSGRLLLAQKITAPNNPLTSRVAVNRIWHHLFGRGIVESVDNLGVLGKTPTHPELLDYLSREFMNHGWSFKKMIKRVMLTKTYQMDSQPNPEAASIDPDNQLLHRARIRRLQGEAIRDSMLSVSGRLDKKMFGPAVPIYLTSFMSGRGRPRKSGPLDGAGRRSIYVAVRRNFLSPMMLAFDTPIPFNAIGKRNVSNVPAQALILMNDPFVLNQAKVWSQRLVKEGKPTGERIEAIYWAGLGRAPTETEIDSATEFLKLQAKELKLQPDDAFTSVELWQDFCHVVFNLKEFIYIK